MNLLVCVKQVRHVYARTGMAPETHFIAPGDALARVNPFDEVAVEWALRVKGAIQGTEVRILTLGPLVAETELRRLLAMGADGLYRIAEERALDAWAVSGGLAKAVALLGADMVLCGKESIDRRDGMVPAYLAHRLGRPFVSSLTSLTVEDGGRSALLERRCGRGKTTVLRCPLPAVFSVEMGGCLPRPVTLEARRRAEEAPILTFLGDEEACWVVQDRVLPPKPRPKPVPSPQSGRDAFGRIGELLSGGRMEKTGKTLAGDPDSQAAGILAFLREQGFLQKTPGLPR